MANRSTAPAREYSQASASRCNRQDAGLLSENYWMSPIEIFWFSSVRPGCQFIGPLISVGILKTRFVVLVIKGLIEERPVPSHQEINLLLCHTYSLYGYNLSKQLH